MKKISLLFFATLFCLTAAAHPAAAGDKQRHRWEGIAIGAATVLLGHAIWHSCQNQHPAETVSVIRRYECHPVCRPMHARGHWEFRKIWVAPVYEKIWQPGHYNRCRNWVPGHWITVKKASGHWVKKKLWISCR